MAGTGQSSTEMEDTLVNLPNIINTTAQRAMSTKCQTAQVLFISAGMPIAMPISLTCL